MSVREFADLLHNFGPAVANHLWQSTAFAAGAAALAFALRKNQARARYWIWMTASLKFLVPFALVAAGVGSLAPRHVVAPANAAVYTAVDQVSEPFVLPILPVESVVQDAPPVYWWALALAGVWGVGFCAVLVTWCVRWRRVAGVVRSAMPLTEGRELVGLERIAAAAGTKQRIRMRVSESTLEPGIFGIARPVLLWPAAISARLGDEQLEAVLAHEVCHVRRRDNLTAAVHMFVEAVFWFHPLAWWMGARLLAERERACDEAVIALCPQPQVYAESILKVCEFCVESPLACVSGITGADLKRRVVDIMTARAVRRRLSLGAKMAITAAAVLAVAVPVVLGTTRILPLYGEIATPAGPLPSMEAATIKPANPEARGKGFRIQGRHLKTINTSLSDLLAYAYDLQARQLVGLPVWAESDKYEIEGVAPSDQQGEPNWKFMMRKLLADRFGLQFHTGTTEMPVYELHVAKNGPKLGPEQPGPGQGSLYLSPASPGPGVTLHAKAQTMAGLAKILEGTEFDRPVVDRTGITGKFDFEMTFLSERMRKGAGAASPMEDEPNAPPGIFTAIQDQLGLKLEPAKGPAETMVIDKVQKPELDVETPGASTAMPVSQVDQASRSSDIAEHLHYDVVSIRPADPNLPQGTSLRFTDDGFQARGVPFEVLVRVAYRLGFVQGAVEGVPEWAQKGSWDLEARVPESDIPEYTKIVHDFTAAGDARRNAILRNMLADRFNFRAHFATKEGTIYRLVVAKSGPKLQPGSDTDQPSMFLRPRGHMEVKNATVAAVAPAFAQELGHPVVDKTGLTRKYSFTLTWTPDRSDSASPDQPPAPDAAPSLFTAIQEQLGLKLEAQKGPVEYLVIDRAEKPSVDAAAARATAVPTLLRVAQTQQSEPPKPLTFEVVSIRENKSGDRQGRMVTSGDGWHMVNLPFEALLQVAFVPRPGGPAIFQNGSIVGMPDWGRDRYDVHAKVPQSPLTDWQKPAEQPALIHAMVQTMLAERCGLKVHRDSKTENILALEIAKGGPKLKPADPNAPPHPEAERVPGMGFAVPEDGGRTLHFYHVNMALFLNVLDKPGTLNIQDHTGLTGTYDFVIHLPEPSATAPGDVPVRPDPREFAETVAAQVGLKLVPMKGQVETLVIDHMDRPTEN